MVSVSVELERDEHNWPLRTSARQTLAHYPLYLYDGTIHPKASTPGVSGPDKCCGRENSTYMLSCLSNLLLGKEISGCGKREWLWKYTDATTGMLGVLPELHS